ncbi:MAG: retropepsin-like aspartic protease [Chthoniobacteraceae bacterium]
MVLLFAMLAHGVAADDLPFRYTHNLIWIKVNVAGRAEPLDFLFDTGAGTTVLNIDTAEKLGLKTGNSEVVRGVDSRTMAKWVKGFDAQVAGMPLERSLLTIDLSAEGKVCGHRIDGLLGADFLKNRVVQIDYAAGKIRWLEHADAPTGAMVATLMKRRNDGWCVAVSIAGKSRQWLRVDTGCDDTVRWVARRPERLGGLHLERRTTVGWRAKTDVQFGGRFFGDVDIAVQEKGMFPDEDGLLGNGLLSKFTVTVDNEKHVLLLKQKQ